MKNLFASVSYSFNNFYNNLNTHGQMIFSSIMFLIGVLCVLLLITYVIQGIQNKKKLAKIKKDVEKEVKEVKNQVNIANASNNINEEVIEKEPLYMEEKTEIEDIAQRVEQALKEETPINLTNFEEDQERTAIISIDELIRRAKELEIIEDEEPTGINYLEKYNLEPAEVNEVINSTMKKEEPKEVKAFKVSQVISPIYGIKKDVISGENK